MSVLFVPGNSYNLKLTKKIINGKKITYKIVDISKEKDIMLSQEIRNSLLKKEIKKEDLIEYKLGQENDILSKYNCRLVIVFNDTDPIQSRFVRIAKEKNILTLMVAEGPVLNLSTAKYRAKITLKKIIDGFRRYSIRYIFDRAAYKLINLIKKEEEPEFFRNVDKIAVWGKKSKDILVSKGIPQENIYVTGGPILNFIKKPLRRLNERIHILVATTNLYGAGYWKKEQLLEFINIIVKTANQCDVYITIRPHPEEDLALYKNFKNNNIIIDNSSDLQKQLAENDIIISEGSNVILEAMFAGKEVFIYAPKKTYIFDILEDYAKFCKTFSNEKELINLIRKYKPTTNFNPNRLKEIAVPENGNIVRLIKRLLKSRYPNI
ncbi:MAG: hypothetical protein QXS93_02665 [Candidatus Micrarchaeia archaeon]